MVILPKTPISYLIVNNIIGFVKQPNWGLSYLITNKNEGCG